MSSYYYFKCSACKEIGGCFERQRSGPGFFDMVDSFKFVFYHSVHCGAECVGVVHDDEAIGLQGVGWKRCNSTLANVDCRKEFIEKTKDIFPFGPDWNIYMHIEKAAEANEEWMKNELRELAPQK